jgi:hypothetical protein
MALMWTFTAAPRSRRARACASFPSAHECFVGLQRELRVDDDGARRVGQADHAICALAVRQGRLEGIGVGRQGLGHDIVQLDFPERAARLLVGQDVLKRQDIARQFLDLGLRAVDLFEFLLQLAERPRGAGRGAVQGLGHAFLHVFQPPFHRLQHAGLRAGLHVGDMAEPTGQPLLTLAEALHGLTEGADVVRQGFHRAGGTVGGAQRGDRQDQQQKKHDGRDGPRDDGGVGDVDDDVANLDHVRPKSRSISLSFSST